MTRPTNLQEKDEDVDEKQLRPNKLTDYVGQERVKGTLAIEIQAALQRGEPLDHCLFYGPPGLGKTTLAFILASEMGVTATVTSGPAIKAPGDLMPAILALQPGDILFIDEIHRLPKIVEEVLYPAMEDQVIDVVLPGKGSGPVRIALPRFTLVGATTRYAMLSAPLRDRFGTVFRLNYYDEDSLSKIVKRSAGVYGVEIAKEAILEIARRARGTPRIANRLLRRVRNYAEVKTKGVITRTSALEALNLLDVDSLGLDEVDYKILHCIIDKFHGGPVGIGTVADAISEEEDTIMDVYEPYLIQLGFLDRTARGRIATPAAYTHLAKEKVK